MLDPDSDIAEQLVHVLSHHQNNLKTRKDAEKKAELLQQMLARLNESLSIGSSLADLR